MSSKARAEAALDTTRLWLIGLAAAIVAGLAGGGGYVLGDSSGPDLAAARAEGAAVGHRAGTLKGAAAGRLAGGQEGGAAGFEQTYANYYRLAYREAFEVAGLDAPTGIEVRP